MGDQQIGARIAQYVRDNSWFLVMITLSLAAIVGPIILDRMGYFREWLGFSGHIYTREITHYNDSGKRITGTDIAQDPRRAKTYWDWLQLLVVPAALAVTGFWFNKRQNIRQQRIEDQHAQDTALQEYLNKMSELLIDKKLHEDPLPHGDTRVTARARTLTVLGQLDGTRKRRVIQFLREARLISTGETLEGRTINRRVVGLDGADLRNADLRKMRLVDADLSGADLSGADLSEADLSGADLSRADLRGARGVDTCRLDIGCKSLRGAAMPDGSRHL